MAPHFLFLLVLVTSYTAHGTTPQAPTTQAMAHTTMPNMGHTETHHPGMGHTGTGMDHTGTHHPGMDHTGTHHPGMGHTGTHHPGMDHTGTHHPGMGHTGTHHPGMGHTGTHHPGMGQTGTHHPGMDHTGTHHPGMDHSGHTMDHGDHTMDHGDHTMNHGDHTMDHGDHTMDHGNHGTHHPGMDHTGHHTMDHGGHGGQTGHGAGHSMYFYFGHQEIIVLFLEWKINSIPALIGSCIGVFAIAVLYEGLKVWREMLIVRAHDSKKAAANSYSLGSIVNGKSTSTLDVEIVPQTIETKTSDKICNCMHVLQSFLHIIQVLVSYGLMLVFMTFNVWLCLSVALGAGAGYFAFGWRRPVTVDRNEHCH